MPRQTQVSTHTISSLSSSPATSTSDVPRRPRIETQLMSSSPAFLGTSDADPSFEFEHNPYHSHHRSSVNREEGLPLHYMSEDKTRRRVKATTVSVFDQQEKESYYGDYYDDEGKDVYSKLRPKSSRLSSGRLPQLPLPPPTSIVSSITFLSVVADLKRNLRPNFSFKTSNTSHPSSTLFSPVGRDTTKLVHPMLSFGMKPILANSARIISSASFTLMFIHRLARCL